MDGLKQNKNLTNESILKNLNTNSRAAHVFINCVKDAAKTEGIEVNLCLLDVNDEGGYIKGQIDFTSYIDANLEVDAKI